MTPQMLTAEQKGELLEVLDYALESLASDFNSLYKSGDDTSEVDRMGVKAERLEKEVRLLHRFQLVDEDDNILESYPSQQEAEHRMAKLEGAYLVDAEEAHQ